MKLDNETLKKRLRYQGAQYSNGQFARGGGREPHMLTQAADLIQELEDKAVGFMGILMAIEVALDSHSPAEILDENSPIRDAIRSVTRATPNAELRGDGPASPARRPA